jgi:hypothetical protein
MSEQTFSATAQTWTINYVINTQELMRKTEKGTWENPVGGSWTDFWKTNTTVIITNNNPNVAPKVIQHYSFDLQVAPNDKIQWIVTDMNPATENLCTVAMYGFVKGAGWSDTLTDPSNVETNIDLMTITPQAFNGKNKPEGNDWLTVKYATISVPTAQVKGGVKAGTTVRYDVKVVLVDIDGRVNTVKNFFQIDPTFTVK